VANTTYRTPLKRWAQPAEMGPAAVYLADPSIEFHTGNMLVVDGPAQCAARSSPAAP
jgi:NAD(P)-dependent dehydrogenase (short-subunit alcohol dehydrogenase family)